jgi:protein-disulfide isomerase
MSSREFDRAIGIWVSLLIFIAAAASARLAVGMSDADGPGLASPQRIVDFVRVRFQIPDTVSLTASPVRPSPFPAFYETKVVSALGARYREQTFFVTKDERCFISGDVFSLTGHSRLEIIRCIREAAKIPQSDKITLGAFQNSVFPGLLKAPIAVEVSGKTERGSVFITADGRTGVLGTVLPFSPGFVERLIDTKRQPSIGPPGALVTIVEYADLECPYCARFQRFLDQDFLPKYRDKVRFVFKECPLPGHPWSTTAAIANECAQQIDPSAFYPYRTLIFASQDSINISNVRERLLDLAGRIGINRLKLAACVDSQASRPRLDADLEEAQNLGVMFLPTAFVNGQIVVPVHSEKFERVVEQALASAEESREGHGARDH